MILTIALALAAAASLVLSITALIRSSNAPGARLKDALTRLNDLEIEHADLLRQFEKVTTLLKRVDNREMQRERRAEASEDPPPRKNGKAKGGDWKAATRAQMAQNIANGQHPVKGIVE